MMDQELPAPGQPLLPQHQVLTLFTNGDEKNAAKDVRDMLAIEVGSEKKYFTVIRFDMISREYRRLCRTDALKKMHVMKYSMIATEINRKLSKSEKPVQEDFYRTEGEVMLYLLKKNLSSENNTQQAAIVALTEAYLDKFQKEPSSLLFLNMIEFQEIPNLLFAFFLKLANNYHKLFIDFCILG